MSFDRFRAQRVCEGFLGCLNLDDWWRADFKNFSLSKTNASTFNNALKEDANDLFYKGLISLSECINSFANRQYSWAVVKGYYSVFYMLKADLALKEIGLIRHKSIYYLEAKEGARPITKGAKGVHRAKYVSDHKATINYYVDFFNGTDILLTQNIHELTSYEWLMEKREQINYRERTFNEPLFPDFLSYIDSEIHASNFKSLIKEIINDTFVKTFQPEYAALAIPIKRAILTRQSFTKSGIAFNIQEDKLKYAQALISIKIEELMND